jgi:branched-chain amino acid transport system substrate-binding protein
MNRMSPARWSAAAALSIMVAASAEAGNAPGVTPTEIKIGQTISYTGIAAAVAGPLGRSERAYFRMINDAGGIRGRKIVLESLDDRFDPERALALTRQLVERDRVAALFSTFGTAQNLDIRDYVNRNGVPDLFVATGDDFVIDPKTYPWTIGGFPVFRIEAEIFGRHILIHMPDSKVGLLLARDNMGDAYRLGLQQGLARHFKERVVTQVDIAADATQIDLEWQMLRRSGAQAVVVAAPALIVARAIVKAHDGDWHPQLFINYASASSTVLGMAGFRKATGVITANAYIDPTSPSWGDAAKPFNDFAAKYLPNAGKADFGYLVAGYVSGQAMVEVLKQCGDDLSRDNIMRQATNLRAFHPTGLIPGITYFTSPTKYLPIVEVALQRFDGRHWIQIGDIMAGF